MTMDTPRWSREELERARELAQQFASETASNAPPPEPEELEPASERSYGAMFRAAAVRSRFRLETLVGAAGDDLEASGLRAKSIVIRDRSGAAWRALLPEVRNDVLRGMSPQELASLVPDTPEEDDSVGNALRRAMQGIPAERLTSIPATELVALTQMHDAIGSVLGVPPRELVERKLELRRLLEPLERITARFGGRENELELLRGYVGVLRPSVVRAANRILSVFRPDRKPPFAVHGLGGVGKTTLIAQFILEHALIDRRNQFPFIYIDFDRPIVTAEEPGTIFIEAVRQLGLQYDTAARPGEGLRTRWDRELRATTLAREQLDRKFIDEFALFLESLEVQDGPVLFVLDTFEEVQQRNSAAANRLLTMLEWLAEKVPRLRVVIASRIPVDSIAKEQTLSLTEFDEKSAVAYLSTKGIDAETASMIVKQVGGSPLTLNLAIAIYEKNPDEVRRGGLGIDAAELQDQVVDTLLFDRILLHIDDDDVKRLSHPGLIVRRITPDIIRYVLAGPCEVSVPDDKRAMELFNKLAEEVTLVTSPEPNVLIHRSDLRKMMLRPARAAAGPRAIEIHELAVQFYQGRTDLISRSEEVYHRLSLAQGREEVAHLVTREMEPYLERSIEELALPEQALLAQLLGREMSAEAAAAADQETWERLTSRKVRQLMATTDYAAARAALAERATEPSGNTDLRVTQTMFLAIAGAQWEAQLAAREGIAAYRKSGNSALLFSMLLVAAGIERRVENYGVAFQHLQEAQEIAKRRQDWLMLVQVLRDIALLTHEAGFELDHEMREELSAAARQVTDTEWLDDLTLLRDVIVELGGHDSVILARAVRLGAIELRSSDLFAVHRALGTEVKDVRAALHDALARTDPPREIVDIVVATLRQAGQRADYSPRSPRTSTDENVRVTLKRGQREMLVNLLTRHFGNRLDAFVERGFDLALEAVTFSDNAPQSASDLVRIAEGEGWLGQLIVAVTRSRYDEPDVLRFIDDIGMGPTLVEAEGKSAVPVKGLRTFLQDHRQTIAALEARTCTIEFNGTVLGCGFLIASDRIVTSEAIAARAKEVGVTVTFDRAFIKGAMVDRGTEAPVDRRGREARPVAPSGIGMIVLDIPLGDDPIDAPRADPDARPRGIIALGRQGFPGTEPLFWLWRDSEGTYLSGGHERLRTNIERGRIQAISSHNALGCAVITAGGRVVGIHGGVLEREELTLLVPVE